MAPSDISKANLDELVEKLTLEESILLTAGVGFWHTHAIPRLNIPAVKVSDGPNGIRGNHFFMGTPAKCLPSATALGATWDPELVEEVGLKLLAGEAKLRAASVALAPTCNIQRNPLGGRSFESFSEDPWLSGIIAAAYVRGTQKGGVGACIKHFATNDKENDRMAYDSQLTDRALREVYLLPFMLAQKYAQPWAYMTAYNRLNGTHCSENPYLLQKILRNEWKFDGLVMSDWFGVYSIDASINAGLDLEMPGTNKWRSLDLMTRSVQSRKLLPRTIKARARRVLQLVQRCAEGAPDVLDGDGTERAEEREDDTKLMRHVAASSIVLLKNEGAVLPLRPKEQGIKKIAIVGGNAKASVLSGGGSAALKPSYFISPYDGFAKAIGSDVELTYAEGAVAYMTLPTLEYELTTADGKDGWTASWFAHKSDDSMEPVSEVYKEQYVDETRCFISDGAPKGITKRWSLKLQGKLKPRAQDCDFEFGLTSAGRAKLYVDGELVVDNWTRQTRGEAFFGCGSTEDKGVAKLKAGIAHDILVEFCNVRAPADGDEDETVMDSNPAVRLGGAEVSNADKLMEEAVNAAKEADAVIVVVGLNADWETEGYDRTTLALAGRTDELVEKVLKVNKKAVVVVQSGSAVTMPWADQAPAVLQAWYLGNATGDAIADIVLGKVNPSGKLSLTFPKRLEDVPSHGHFNSENGKVWYSEDLFVGYKHYQHRKIDPLWHFGHGLSYTTFEFADLKLSKPIIKDGELSVTASVAVTNTGSLAGSEVVQVYTTIPSTADPALTQVPFMLRAFTKVTLQPGESKTIDLPLDKYAASYWDERHGAWSVDKGEYVVRAGPASNNLPLKATFVVEKGFEWNGL